MLGPFGVEWLRLYTENIDNRNKYDISSAGFQPAAYEWKGLNWIMIFCSEIG